MNVHVLFNFWKYSVTFWSFNPVNETLFLYGWYLRANFLCITVTSLLFAPIHNTKNPNKYIKLPLFSIFLKLYYREGKGDLSYGECEGGGVIFIRGVEVGIELNDSRDSDSKINSLLFLKFIAKLIQYSSSSTWKIHISKDQILSNILGSKIFRFSTFFFYFTFKVIVLFTF